jgi:hypothetical protein
LDNREFSVFTQNTDVAAGWRNSNIGTKALDRLKKRIVRLLPDRFRARKMLCDCLNPTDLRFIRLKNDEGNCPRMTGP